MKGAISDALNLPEGCKFNPRYPCVIEKCKLNVPKLIKIKPDHYVACFKKNKIEVKEIARSRRAGTVIRRTLERSQITGNNTLI